MVFWVPATPPPPRSTSQTPIFLIPFNLPSPIRVDWLSYGAVCKRRATVNMFASADDLDEWFPRRGDRSERERQCSVWGMTCLLCSLLWGRYR